MHRLSSSSSSSSSCNELLLPMATLAMVALGLTVIVITLVWPALLMWLWLHTTTRPMRTSGDDNGDHTSHVVLLYNNAPPTATSIAIALLVLLLPIHWRMLYRNPNYLAVARVLWLPVRRCILPLVIWIARIESIRKELPRYILLCHPQRPWHRRRHPSVTHCSYKIFDPVFDGAFNKWNKSIAANGCRIQQCTEKETHGG